MHFREYTIFQGSLLSAWVVANHPWQGGSPDFPLKVAALE
jgi:hypothetical protein